MVKAYTVTTTGYEVSSDFLKKNNPVGEQLYQSLRGAKMVASRTELKQFLHRVTDAAKIRVPAKKPVSLEGQKMIAVSLDSEWYSRDGGNWSLTPMVNIVPSLTAKKTKKLVEKANRDQKNKSAAMTKFATVVQKSSAMWGYFVPAYNMSR